MIVDYNDSHEIERSFDVKSNHLPVRKSGTCRTVFVLEDLRTEWIEYLGSMLDVDPQFFLNQIQATDWEHHNDKALPLMLPSVRNSAQFKTLRYMEAIALEKWFKPKRTRLAETNVLRRLSIRNPQKDNRGKEKSVGLITRICSFWKREHRNGNFEAIVLLDPPLNSPVGFYIEDSNRSDQEKSHPHRSGEARQLEHTYWQLYGGGYVDFGLGGPRRDWPARAREGSKWAISVDLREHLERSYLYTKSPLDALQNNFLFLQKIVLSNWMLALALLQRDFYSLELGKLTDEHATVGEVTPTLNDLRSSRSLLSKCCAWVRQDITMLEVNLDDVKVRSNPHGHNTNVMEPADDMELVKRDWAFLYQQFCSFRDESETLLGTHMTNLQVLESKRAREDSISFNQLAFLGQIIVLVFAPLGCAYGILSMGGDFAPGKPGFAIFWAIAIPLTALTILAFIFLPSWWARRLATLKKSHVKVSVKEHSALRTMV